MTIKKRQHWETRVKIPMHAQLYAHYDSMHAQIYWIKKLGLDWILCFLNGHPWLYKILRLYTLILTITIQDSFL